MIVLYVYLLSIFIAWLYNKLAYSKGGVWSNLDPELADVILMFVPAINSLYFLLFLFDYPKRSKSGSRLITFFNIKK